jgi:hypothetical protein
LIRFRSWFAIFRYQAIGWQSQQPRRLFALRLRGDSSSFTSGYSLSLILSG